MEKSHQKYSTTVSKALDALGYSNDHIKIRQAVWEETSWIKVDPEKTLIFAGSKADGVSGFFENDVDVMISLNNVVCCEDIQEVNQDRYNAVFMMDRDNVAPGYTRLRHVDFNKARRSGIDDVLVTATFQNEEGDFLLSSEFLANTKCQENAWSRSGPAATTTTNIDDDEPSSILFYNDAVWALPCKSKKILQPWVSRPRHHAWPSREVIQEISTIDGHAVPVGVKGSGKQYEEWRICYTPAEIRLVKSFNETQLKLYVLLKAVAKKLLTPVCPDITSYIIKNLVFWVSELCPLAWFTQENLMDLLILSLRRLWDLVNTEYLRNYMIQARNMFAGKLEQQHKQDLLVLIASLVREGPTFILHCPELHVISSKMVQVIRQPELAFYEQYNREQTEIVTFRTMFGIFQFADILKLPWIDVMQSYVQQAMYGNTPVLELFTNLFNICFTIYKLMLGVNN